MIHARLKLNYSGFSLDVDLQLPGRGAVSYTHLTLPTSDLV